jgi:hypothetical protein
LKLLCRYLIHGTPRSWVTSPIIRGPVKRRFFSFSPGPFAGGHLWHFQSSANGSILDCFCLSFFFDFLSKTTPYQFNANFLTITARKKLSIDELSKQKKSTALWLMLRKST